MAEPIDHTLVLLREIRGAVAAVDNKVDALENKVDALENKVDRNHEDVVKRIENLRQAFLGESVLGMYAAAEVEERLKAIENRLTTLEQRE
jgi:chaperonin cofactor prefoldin